MAIRKHNRTIWVLAAAIILLLVLLLARDGKITGLFEKAESLPEAGSPVSEEQFGDQVPRDGQSRGQDQQNFSETLNRMASCFQVSGSTLPEASAVQIDTLYQKFQADFGSVTSQTDRWVTWHLRAPEGKEFRLRLEITETDEGKVGRELHLFSIDRSGNPSPVELPPEKANNPTDETISQMLKEGEVYTKERAAVGFFANNERVEYVEKDNELFELEFVKDETRFRCANVKNPNSCQCQ